MVNQVIPATNEEMEHYLMFPDLYCKGHEGGAGPLCEECLEKKIKEDEISKYMSEMYEEENNG